MASHEIEEVDYFDEESAVEPDCAVKLGPFSCFFACAPKDPRRSRAGRDLPAPTDRGKRNDVSQPYERLPSGSQALHERFPTVPSSSSSQFHVGEAARPDEESFVIAPIGGESLEATPRKGVDRGRSLLGPVLVSLEAAIIAGDKPGHAADLRRKELLHGVNTLATVLDKLGGDMGSYLIKNTAKIANSKTVSLDTGYRQWLMDELPHHGPKFGGYADESAWMGNLWMAWTLEFFVEFFAELHGGKETRPGIDAAYKKTLQHHHNFIQRQVFNTGVSRLPGRTDLYKLLQASATLSHVELDIGAFVTVGRTVVSFCLDMNETVSKLMDVERKRIGG